MPVKITIFYNQANRGWTETWYAPFSSVTVPINNAAWQKFFSSSIAFRATPTLIYAMRVSGIKPGVLGSQLYNFGNTYDQSPGGFNVSGNPDVATTDAVYQMTGATSPLAKKLMFLRGLEDAVVSRTADGTDVIDPGLQKAVNAMVTAAAALGLQIRYKSLANPQVQVTSVSPNAGNVNYTDLTLNAAIVLTPPAPYAVVLYGVPTDNMPGCPKVAKVITSVAGPPAVLTIGYRLRSSSIPVTPANMRATQLFYAYDTVNTTTTTFKFWSEHKTGRPFGSLRGRTRSLVRAI